MKREIQLPDREPIRDWRMVLVVTETNEIIIDRVGVDDEEAVAILQNVAAMIDARQG